MSYLRERVSVWTADLEDDLADPGSTYVFVPSVMGAGILVSLGILLGDLRRALFGKAGEARQDIRVRRAARSLVVPIAAAIGAELHHPRKCDAGCAADGCTPSSVWSRWSWRSTSGSARRRTTRTAVDTSRGSCRSRRSRWA